MTTGPEFTQPDAELAPQADPSALTGSAVSQSFEDDPYAQKVEYATGIFRAELDEKVTAGAQGMIRRTEQRDYGLSERVDFYEAVREQQAKDASGKVGAVIHDLQAARGQARQGEGDAFDRVVDLVALDRSGYAPGSGHDNVAFAAGRHTANDLDEFTYTDKGQRDVLRDPAILAKAQRTIGMLVNHGVYKLAKWGDSSQLDTALSLVNSYTEWVPEFDPDKAAVGDAAYALIGQRAAIQADQTTKPNYQYAKPERRHLNEVTDAGLNAVAEVQAHHLLRTHDIDLPPAAAAEQ